MHMSGPDIPISPADLGFLPPVLRGAIKTLASDFHVTEIPAYEASGNGQYLYFKIRRSNLNTKEVLQILARLFSLPEGEVGYAGLKDRNAVCTQLFSVPIFRIPGISPDSSSAAVIEKEIHNQWKNLDGELELLEILRHENSLRRGHLAGNRFSILVRDLGPAADSAGNLDSKAGSIQELLQSAASHWMEKGMINLYGPQRFGKEGSTLQQGLSFMDGKKARKWLLDLGVSAVQSYAFNYYLRLRNEQGKLFDLLDGDLAVKSESGGIFKVPVADQESSRMSSGEISYTGPMFGKKMRSPEGPSLQLEMDTLSYLGKTEEDFKKMKVPGARRAGIIPLHDLELEWETDESVWMKFSLPAGSYATVAISHLIQLEENSERSL